MSHKNSNQ